MQQGLNSARLPSNCRTGQRALSSWPACIRDRGARGRQVRARWNRGRLPNGSCEEGGSPDGRWEGATDPVAGEVERVQGPQGEEFRGDLTLHSRQIGSVQDGLSGTCGGHCQIASGWEKDGATRAGGSRVRRTPTTQDVAKHAHSIRPSPQTTLRAEASS